MRADRFAQMESFVRVAQTGSFSAAAREAGLSQPAISKQIAALENRLRARLFNRTTRTLTLTPEGARFLDAARTALDASEAADASVAGASSPSGLLRIAAPVAFGQLHVAPRVSAFLGRYPEVDIDLRLADHFVDLVSEGIELAIRVGDLSDSSMVARRIGMAPRVCVAAPSYLKRRRAPKTPEDIHAHDCVIYSRLQEPVWRFRTAEGFVDIAPKGRLRTDSSVAVREAVIAGLGLGCNPLWLYADDLREGKVVEVLAEFAPPPLPIHLVSPARGFVTARATAMGEFLAAAFREDVSLAAR